jgi:phosphoribosylformimino-5-aminoimidazole carboxamide ribotide isomerase
LGPPDLLQPASWPERLIVMNLDHVGADNGPDIDQLKTLMALRPDCDWYAAGGVRNIDDIMALENAGASGVLIASALHRGKIDKQAITRLLAKK